MGDDKATTTAWHGVIAGAVSGILSRFIVYPLDTIKTRLQVQAQTGGIGGRLRNLYSGFNAVVLFVVPGNSLYFGGYELGHDILPRSWGPAREFGSGALAQLFGGLVFTPMDVIKERRQAASMLNGAARGAPIKSLVSQLGLNGLMRGYWVSTALWLPWSSVYAAAYGHFRSLLQQPSYVHGQDLNNNAQQSKDITMAETALCAAGGATVASILTHPIDVVKTQLQVLSGKPGYATNLTSFDYMRLLWAREGWKGFGRGLGARIGSLAPQSALAWAIYEKIKSNLGDKGNKILSHPQKDSSCVVAGQKTSGFNV